MGPVIFETVPWMFSFAAVVALTQLLIILAGTGKRYLKQVSIAAVAISAAVIGGRIAITYQWPVIAGIVAGVAGGALLGRLLRPVGVGFALAFLGFSVSYNILGIEDVQYVAAVVLFAYGLLLTDLAPTFVSGLLASAMLLLLAEWAGASADLVLISLTTLAAVRILAVLLSPRYRSRTSYPQVFGVS